MSVRVVLDRPSGHVYTNLDFVTGRAILILPTDTTISAITVKLEGESRTRLAGPKTPYNDEKKKTELEVHKILYKVQNVFPSPELQSGGTTKAQFTLLRGQYEYPFRFKIPFNNDCMNNTSLIKDLKVGQLNVQFVQGSNHIKRTLPPTLSGFPGEAEIKYYVKATVVRPKFYQEKFRFVGLTFMPIEPPRLSDRSEEIFARRKHQFQHYNAPPKKKGLLRRASEVAPKSEPLAFQVDARLPNPAVLTCSEPLPLRILVEKLNQSDANVYLSMLQIELIGYTSVRAQDLKRIESGSWILMSQANMNLPIDSPTQTNVREWKIPPTYWDKITVPNTVAPSFDICNLSRRYELEIRIGLAHGMADGVRPELIVLPLRLEVKVYSGIAPPPQLLHMMATQQAYPLTPSKQRLDVGTKPDSYDLQGQSTPVTPATPTQDHYKQFDAQVGSHNAAHPPMDDADDLPPSYEDAMAEDLAPVDGPRREYSVFESSGPAFNSDSKASGGLGRMPSERLFSQNGPRRPGSGPRRTFSVETASVLEDSTDAPLYQPRSVSGSLVGFNDQKEDPWTRSEEPGPPLPTRKSTKEHDQREKS